MDETNVVQDKRRDEDEQRRDEEMWQWRRALKPIGADVAGSLTTGQVRALRGPNRISGRGVASR
ncbi:hypothetical protein [Actinomadura sp. NPDC048394]|uniref:hypothetical protein n=1 Tax=Actinomadura sp. NPDC048394 TaxID=3158223 RepID=UPI0033E6FA2A